jgi:hypothetical protein
MKTMRQYSNPRRIRHWHRAGNAIFVQQAVYESIPEAHRPPLDTSRTISARNTLFDCEINISESTILSFLLLDEKTNTKFRLKIHAPVAPHLATGMYIGDDLPIVNGQLEKSVILTLDNKREVWVKVRRI